MSVIDQVTDQLATIDLKDEDISEYITGIIEDESMEEGEKREVISEFLAEATDRDTEALINTLLTDWKKVKHGQEKEAEEKKSKLIEEARAREEERRFRAEKEQEENLTLRTAQKQLSEEQKKEREKLMQQYGYVAEGDEEENAEHSELTPRDRRRGKTLPVADPLLAANRNADMVKEKEQARREQMKQVSDKEKERNKMLQEKQKKEKVHDKEKKKTQKGERRRM